MTEVRIVPIGIREIGTTQMSIGEVKAPEVSFTPISVVKIKEVRMI